MEGIGNRCPLNLVLITPECSRYYREVVVGQLEKLRGAVTKERVVRFIREQLASREKECDLRMLEDMLQEGVPFFQKALPVMISEMLEKGAIGKILILQADSSLTLTKYQIFLLMCHLFFCTMPAQF